MKDLAGKVAFVTGAASGIGLGVSRSLAQAGVRVMMSDIDEVALEKAAGDLRRTNAEVDCVVADVSLKDELRAAAEAVLGRFGAIHILHNNAGIAGESGYGLWSDAGWQWSIGVNLMSVVWGCEIFGPLIERHGQGGHIVNTSSASGLVTANSRAYAATKYAVVALSEGLRAELAPRGIGVSALCPGFIRTGFVDGARSLPERFAKDLPAQRASKEGAREKWLEDIRDRINSGIDPLHVGELVREGIEQDWPYIFTDTIVESSIDARFAAIKSCLDHVRDRAT